MPAIIIRLRINRAFADANAFSETSAKSLEQLNLQRYQPMINSLYRIGTVEKAPNGKYYMNHDDYLRLKKIKFTVLQIMFIMCIIAAIFYFIITR